jgi:malate dehydrogenase (oxaloacetate-decarboxylating)(NADP+)
VSFFQSHSPSNAVEFAFLGLGLGAIISRASSVTDSMVEASSLGLAGSLTPEEESLGMLYPRIERIREISAHITVQVIKAAQAAVSRRFYSMCVER